MLRPIYTKRLILIPVTFEITSSLLDNNFDPLHKIGVNTDNNWPRQDTFDILPLVNQILETDSPSGYEFWMIIRKDTNYVIGDIGFHGKPDRMGEVEIGYGITQPERGKKFGYEALNAIMEWLHTKQEVKRIKASCLVTNKPSLHILEKVGMTEIARDHKKTYWELKKED